MYIVGMGLVVCFIRRLVDCWVMLVYLRTTLLVLHTALDRVSDIECDNFRALYICLFLTERYKGLLSS